MGTYVGSASPCNGIPKVLLLYTPNCPLGVTRWAFNQQWTPSNPLRATKPSNGVALRVILAFRGTYEGTSEPLQRHPQGLVLSLLMTCSGRLFQSASSSARTSLRRVIVGVQSSTPSAVSRSSMAMVWVRRKAKDSKSLVLLMRSLYQKSHSIATP